MTLYIIIAILIGSVIGWLIAQVTANKALRTENQKYRTLEIEYSSLKATDEQKISSLNGIIENRREEIESFREVLDKKSKDALSIQHNYLTADAELKAAKQTLVEKNDELASKKEELSNLNAEFSTLSQTLATANAINQSLREKQNTQKSEMEDMGRKFNLEFENIANKILETKAEKFTEINKNNLKSILEPLGQNISAFKTKVEEVYDKESKERFSLGEKVRELATLNQIMTDEARNLTKALKGESKTQGRWGEMILESILEKSGLVKDREYFMEYQLVNNDGKPLISDSEGKKMRPDAVIKYPDNRNVIIDSKVSLNSFVRYMDASELDEQHTQLTAHINAIKSHIVALSAKGYDDYDKALDFVMMFIPNESAYIAALKGDADLWNFAYDKRILLLSPTNLITSLKLIVDLWKRENQNRNALEIAERGAKLYDKFVGFIDNLDDVGDHLNKAQGKYHEAYKQLTTGNDNLVVQATKLKNLGLKTKKKLPSFLLNEITNSGND